MSSTGQLACQFNPASLADGRISEAQLVRLWTIFARSSPTFWSSSGKLLKIIRPGYVNHSSGPDIFEATLEIAGITRTGAIELHLHPESWYQHGHHHDPGYNNLILHISLRPGKSLGIRRQDGIEVPHLVLTKSIEFKRFVRQTGPVELFDRQLDRRRISDYFTAAGVAWLLHQVGYLWRLPPTRQVFQPLIESLGFTYNHRAFRGLARRISAAEFYQQLTRYSKVAELEGWLLGTAGWFVNRAGRAVNRSIRRRRRCWRQISGRTLIEQAGYWRFAAVRPQAYPHRRWVLFGWATRRLSISWERWFWQVGRQALSKANPSVYLKTRLLELFRFPRGSYWCYHYSFTDPRRDARAAVGPAWAEQLIVNLWLPYLYMRAMKTADYDLQREVEQVLRCYPPVLENRRTRLLARRCNQFSEFQWESALQQQGAVLIYKYGCKKLNCENCLFG